MKILTFSLENVSLSKHFAAIDKIDSNRLALGQVYWHGLPNKARCDTRSFLKWGAPNTYL